MWVTATDGRSEGAITVVQPGSTAMAPATQRRAADQWLFVLEGTGSMVVGGQKLSVAPGSLLLIEAGDAPEIRNTGKVPLKTISVRLPDCQHLN